YFSGLHVHHTYYINGFRPWEYQASSFMTLCCECHDNLHKNQKVPIYNSEEELNKIGELTCCSKCRGTGWFTEYLHVQGGVCFKCNGAKYNELINLDINI